MHISTPHLPKLAMTMVMMMMVMMRITITQQWLHPSDAGGAKRGGGQCEAARCQHVPHGDPGAHHSQQDKMMIKMGFMVISGKHAKNVSKYGLLPHDPKHGNIGFKKSSKQGE